VSVGKGPFHSRTYSYPNLPGVGSKKPSAPPRNGHGESLNVIIQDTSGDDNTVDPDAGPDSTVTPAVQDWNTPGCSDRDPSAEPQNGVSVLQAKKLPAAQCDMTQSSRVPYNVFNGTVYGTFCRFAGLGKNPIKWPFDVQGNFKPQGTQKRKVRRTPPPNPVAFADYTIALEWQPKSPFNEDDCLTSCESVFSRIAGSPCGHTSGKSKDEYLV